MKRRSQKAIAIAVLGTLALLAADLGTKEWASANLAVDRMGEPPPVCAGQGMQHLPGERTVLVEGYLELSYAENCGAAFGLLRDAPDWLRRSIFGVAALAAAVVLFVMFVQGRGGPMFAYSVPLIVSGAVGNLVDRVRAGYVVDFIRFHLEERWEYPTFNVADITITVGVALLILDGFAQEAKAKKSDSSKSEAKPTEDDEASDEEPPAPKRKKRKGGKAKPSPEAASEG